MGGCAVVFSGCDGCASGSWSVSKGDDRAVPSVTLDMDAAEETECAESDAHVSAERAERTEKREFGRSIRGELSRLGDSSPRLSEESEKEPDENERVLSKEDRRDGRDDARLTMAADDVGMLDIVPLVGAVEQGGLLSSLAERRRNCCRNGEDGDMVNSATCR